MSQELKDNYPIVPGRGLVTPVSTQLRLEFMESIGKKSEMIHQHHLAYPSIQNKIESFIGSVEIPVGLIGPLLFKNNEKSEYVYGAAGTLEGALIASMNRGAKAVSLSGGFQAEIIHQRMVRCPMFILNDIVEAVKFKNWLHLNFEKIKAETELHSNHAVLIDLSISITGNCVHSRFIFTTGDASGQNMTTTCTWYGMLFIVKQFELESGIKIQQYVIEGNGSSDKKVSFRSMIEGRGVNVISDCFLSDHIIQKVLRTTADQILSCYSPSVVAARLDGMMGYNINVANAVAAIFLATGQDMASVHESSLAVLNLQKKENGLYLSLNLPSLVIGTVGGGTSVGKQNEVLKIMDCDGEGKVERLAKLIAGFALSLEISTYAAIVSGEFAKAHEKLGRNKPVDWLLRSELNQEFIFPIIQNKIVIEENSSLSFETDSTENGIITNLTSRTNKKIIGFIPLIVRTKNVDRSILIKSKALDIEVIKGLHSMAASIDPELSDLIFKYRHHLEYRDSHLKEIRVYEFLDAHKLNISPTLFGKFKDEKREIFLLFIEKLQKDKMKLFNSENKPEQWNFENKQNAIQTITQFHQHPSVSELMEEPIFHTFQPYDSAPLYLKFISVIIGDEENPEKKKQLQKLTGFLNDLSNDSIVNSLPKTIIHNDYNPRNLALSLNNEILIYDWELAIKNIPHRDVVEFLAFVLDKNFKAEELLSLLNYHSGLWKMESTNQKWIEGYLHATKEFLVCRVTFYKASEILMKLKFTDRILTNCFRIIECLEQELIQLKKTNAELA